MTLKPSTASPSVVRECKVFEQHKISLPLSIQKRTEKATCFGYFIPAGQDMWQGLSQLSLQQLQEIIVFSTDQGSFFLSQSPFFPENLSKYPLTLVTQSPLLFISTTYEIKLPLHAKIEMPSFFYLGSVVIGLDNGENLDWYFFAPDQKKTIAQTMYLKTPLQVFRSVATTPQVVFQESPSFQETNLPDSQKWDQKPSSWFFENNSFASKKLRQLWEWVGQRYKFLQLVTKKNKQPKKLSTAKKILLWFLRKLYFFWLWFGKTFFPFSLAKFSLQEANPTSLRKYLERQNQLLERLAQLLEQGELSSALAHAIPFSKSFTTAMKKHGLLAADWQLPNNAVQYSQENNNKQGKQGLVFIGESLLKRLIWNYHQAGKAMLNKGKYNEAAYVYSYLLKDYKTAAYCLVKGGMYLEAASLWATQLEDKEKASEVLIMGGFIHEAARIYLEDNNYQQATKIYQEAQMPSELESCLQDWSEYLIGQERYLEAGDLLETRLKNIPQAIKYFHKATENLREMGGAYSRLWANSEWTWQEARQKLEDMIENCPPRVSVDNVIQFASYSRSNLQRGMTIREKKDLKKRLVSLALQLATSHPKSCSSLVEELSQQIPKEIDPFFIEDFARGIAQRKESLTIKSEEKSKFINFIDVPSPTEILVCNQSEILQFSPQGISRYSHSCNDIQSIAIDSSKNLFCMSNNELFQFHLSPNKNQATASKIFSKKIIDFQLSQEGILVLTQEGEESCFYFLDTSKKTFPKRLLFSWNEIEISDFTFWPSRSQIIITTTKGIKLFTFELQNTAPIRYLTSFYAEDQTLHRTKAFHGLVVGFNHKNRTWKALNWKSGKLRFLLLELPNKSVKDYLLVRNETIFVFISTHENAQIHISRFRFFSGELSFVNMEQHTLPIHEIASICVSGQEVFCVSEQGEIWTIHIQNGNRRQLLHND